MDTADNRPDEVEDELPYPPWMTDEDFDRIQGIALNPWRAKLKDIPITAQTIYHHAAWLAMNYDGDRQGPLWSARTAQADTLLAVLQARSLRRATWALVIATIGLVIVTGLLVWVTLRSA